jgi:hypothetical protein
MGRRWLMRVVVGLAAFLAIASHLAVGQGVVAQEPGATPPADADAMETMSRPIHIHAGSCESLGDVVYPLNDLQPPELIGEPPSGISTPVAGMTDATPVATPPAGSDEGTVASSTTIEVSLEELVSGDFAINVHESADAMQNHLACGDIEGDTAGNQVNFRLTEIDDSGYSGHVTITESEEGTVIVSVMLAPLEAGVDTGVATPSP